MDEEVEKEEEEEDMLFAKALSLSQNRRLKATAVINYLGNREEHQGKNVRRKIGRLVEWFGRQYSLSRQQFRRGAISLESMGY